MDWMSGSSGAYNGQGRGWQASQTGVGSSSWYTPGVGADVAHGASTVLGTLDALRSGSSASAIYKGAAKNVKKANDFENAQLAGFGKEAVASSQRQALDEKKQADLAISRATAVAAGTGGGASDPGVMSIIGRLASEGNTNAMSALYTGQAAQQEYANKIKANDFEAKSTAAGYKMKASAENGGKWNSAIATVLNGVPSFLEKYG